MIKGIKNIAIIGGGESGVGAAILAKKMGYTPFVSDYGSIKDEYKEELTSNKIRFEEGRHDFVKILSADMAIKSPGVPDKVMIIKELKDQKTPVISEIEFASWFTDATIIAITGSNGKTTTTSLINDVIKRAGKDVALAGNIGYSACRMVADRKCDFLVLEVSSFQLDDIKDFKPHIAIITNITPDHLDRYNGSMELYTEAKLKISKNQDENDYLIYCADDPITSHAFSDHHINANIIPFSTEKEVKNGAFLNEQKQIEIHLKNFGTMKIDQLALQGRHNTYNSMAASLTAKILKIRNESIRESMANFASLEHRLEPVLDISGIEFINDSKATNINSTYYALESMRKPTIWIVGGVDKGNDYSELTELVMDKVKGIICLGKDNEKIHAEFENMVEHMVDADSMEAAVKAAYKMGKKGDTVLLSPACASFDLFKNYEDRGRQFKEEIRKL